MPRASDYLLPGYIYHLTQRCHNRQHLLCFARDRDVYRAWLREGVERHRVPVYGFCITSNHIHVVAHADDVAAIAQFMHLASGATAKQYNLRKERTGSMWEHPYQCRIVTSTNLRSGQCARSLPLTMHFLGQKIAAKTGYDPVFDRKEMKYRYLATGTVGEPSITR